MFYEKMADEINRILDFDSLDLIEGKVEVNLPGTEGIALMATVEEYQNSVRDLSKR